MPIGRCELRRALLALLALAALAGFGLRPASAEPRIALVIGNAAYAKGPLKTPLADAGLIATALNSVGFEIVEGADLGQADLRAKFREFLDKVQAAGPDVIAMVYFSGYGLEYEGENYLVPVDARLDRETDILIDAIRVSDLVRPLVGSPGRARIVVVDGARTLPFALTGAKLARGLGAMEAPPGTLIAASASPGTVSAEETVAYGSYAKALAEMIRTPGLDLGAIFMRARVRTHVSTQGAQTPWHVSALTDPIVLNPGGPDAGPPDPSQPAAPPAAMIASQKPRPMRELSVEDAYALAIERDELPTYVEYVQAYPRSPYAKRIWAQIRARREALAWMRAVQRNTPEAYWTYLRRYPGGVYAFDAQRRLRHLAAREEPPSSFAIVEFADVPPALADEPTDAYEVYDPGPPLPRLIDPPPAFYVNLPAPQRARGPRLLPMPVPMSVSPRIGTPPPRFGAPVSALPPTGRVIGARPRGPTGFVNPNPTGGPGPKYRTNPNVRPPTGTVTTVTPPNGPPPKPPTLGPKPAPAFSARTPTGVQPPRPPTAPAIRAPGPPAVAVQGVKPSPAAKLPPPGPPPGPRKKCPIVNGVENCNAR
jgi:uncharacterized caspase-like protein